MTYTPATKLPLLTALTYFDWSTPTAPNPKLAAPISATATTITFTSAPLDRSGTVITAGFVMGIKKANSYVEGVYVPAAGLSANGLTATGCVRGIRLDGLDYTTGDTTLATTHLQDEPVSCIIHPALQQILVNALQGVGDMATGGTDFVLGAGAAGTITIKRNNGSALGFLRHNGTSVQYSDAGSTWTNLSDISASDIVKVSSNDTTPGYLNGKLVAGSNITLTEGNDGGNETLTITSASANSGITTHIIYTPGYLTGGAAPTSNYLLWLGTTAGSFQVTIDGTARSITGINFSSGVASMSDVASKIQTALRAVTSSTETVTWSGTRFVITSASTASTSAVSVLTAGVSGTDISGATAGDPNMDSDTGNGIATAAVLNPAADVGKVGFLDANGLYDKGLIPGFGGTGADGALNVTSGTTTLALGSEAVVTKNYSSINISSGATFTFSGANSSGTILVLKCQNYCTIAGTITGTGFGGIGGTGGAAGINGAAGSSGTSGSQASNYYLDALTHNGSNGAGGASTAGGYAGGSAGSAGSAYELTTFYATQYRKMVTLVPGAGGGAGGGGGAGLNAGGAADGDGGAGGAGGIALYIEVKGALIFTGTISANGVAGSNGETGSSYASDGGHGGGGGGGGGAGGMIYILANTITTNTGTIAVTGGAAGTGGAGGTGGGGDSGGGGGGGASGAGGYAGASSSGTAGSAGAGVNGGAGGAGSAGKDGTSLVEANVTF